MPKNARRHRERMQIDPEYRARVKAKEKARHKRRMQNDVKYRQKRQRRKLLQQYGMVPRDFDVFMEMQDGRCAICRIAPSEQRLDIDHNHRTGYIRGLLCRDCNLGLGRFKDRIDLLEAALAYLRRSA